MFLLLLSWPILGQKSQIVYRTKGDTTENFYLALLPEKISRGLLVILPGFGTTPSEVLQETRLPLISCKAGYTVVIPLLVAYQKEDLSSMFQMRLEALIPELLSKYRIAKDKLMIGGHSLGGHQALYYAEQAYRLNKDQIVKPILVFGVDPPLDLKRLWDSFQYNKRIRFSAVSAGEADYMITRFRKLYGGSPQEKPTVYREASSFYREAKDGGNAKYLKSVPVRLYCDPDIDWVIENRRGSFEYMNAADLSACISQLKLLGNTKAEFVSCLGKGYLPDGRRHPHAFSILDADEFITWADKILKTE